MEPPLRPRRLHGVLSRILEGGVTSPLGNSEPLVGHGLETVRLTYSVKGFRHRNVQKRLSFLFNVICSIFHKSCFFNVFPSVWEAFFKSKTTNVFLLKHQHLFFPKLCTRSWETFFPAFSQFFGKFRTPKRNTRF